MSPVNEMRDRRSNEDADDPETITTKQRIDTMGLRQQEQDEHLDLIEKRVADAVARINRLERELGL